VDVTESIIDCLEQSGVETPVIEQTIAQYLQLQRVSQLVMMMCRRAEEGDFDQLNVLYAERDSVVNAVIRARESLRPLILNGTTRQRMNGFFEPVVRAIDMWDARLLAILQEKRRSIVEKSKEAQLRRLVLKYST
jgi:hypothetical protein